MAKPRKPPALPKQLWSPLGPVSVIEVDRIKPVNPDAPDDASDLGVFDHETRTIRILRRLPPWVKWQTFRHEWFHMIVFDAGYHNGLDDELIEALCDLVGTALTAEMRNR